MRHFDLAPVYRSTVGFDRLFSALDQFASEPTGVASYPPYDIVRTGENAYGITLAVAGFTPEELDIETRDGTLTVRGRRKDEAQPASDYLHRGIATRSFERRFRLAEHVSVTEARVSDGLLHVGLVREVPEAAKPRRIEIGSANGNARAVESAAA